MRELQLHTTCVVKVTRPRHLHIIHLCFRLLGATNPTWRNHDSWTPLDPPDNILPLDNLTPNSQMSTMSQSDPSNVPSPRRIKRLEERQRLRAIVAKTSDLLDPPNTAEAFARLEAAMDQAKLEDTTGNDNAVEHKLLDPPTTAERFALIESAIDEVLAVSKHGSHSVRRSRRRHKSDPRLTTDAMELHRKQEMHLLRKQPCQMADLAAHANLAAPDISSTEGRPTTNEHHSTGSRMFQSPRDVYGPSKEPGRTVEGVHVLARTVPLPPSSDTVTFYNGQEELHQDTDIFRSGDAMKEFANQAYQSARQKYL